MQFAAQAATIALMAHDRRNGNMPWITPTQATKLKLRPIDSSELPPGGWRDRKVGDKLGIVSVRKVPGDTKHWEIRFAGELTIGGIPRKTCFIFADHWSGVGAVYQEAKAAAQVQRLNALPTPSNKVLSPVPYLSQRDNAENPNGACNVTSFAMMFGYFGIAKRTNAAQFEDELYRYMEDNGLSRHSPIDLRNMARAYGLIDDFESTATIEQVKKHLSSGRPVVTHGYFTSFGHIIALIGYDETGFIVHDPYGEWTSGGYDRNDPNGNNAKGKQLHYSYGLIERTCLTDNQFWVHFVDREGWQPPTVAPTKSATPRMFQPQEFQVVPAAIAIKKSWEDFRPNRYLCQAGIPTIGWGTTRWWDGGEIPIGATVTEAEAEKLVARDLEECVAELRDCIDVPLSENQLAALISWQYNTGAIRSNPCGLRDAINGQRGDEAIKAEFRRWNKVAVPGKGLLVSQGLANRRESECALWDGRDWRQYRG
jgi:GH24 family phage-related lysozyme (muramidase)/uncharacterized protein YvpB